MRRALALLCLLASCAAEPQTPEPQTLEMAACRKQADHDRVVQDLEMKGAGSDMFRREHEETLKQARQQATLDCLRGRGLVRPGGVERQRPI